jgi:hypothetical protein
MSHFATDADRAAAPHHRAQVLAEAVVSAYIDEIARSGRRQHRAASVPSLRATAPQARRRRSQRAFRARTEHAPAPRPASSPSGETPARCRAAAHRAVR